jgi:predicted amidophosphoribosyltransferase
LKEQQRKYNCPDCEASVVFYSYKCPNCGYEMDLE